MCGIVGYIGKQTALDPILNGLKALEYRGYDSAGVAVISRDGAHLVKQVGRVDGLEKAVKSLGKTRAPIGIGHTRWATHGSPTQSNAHPHSNSDSTIFVVHNGIIENYQELRARLQKAGYKFASETDTEVVPHLIDFHLQHTKNFEKAFIHTVEELQGAYAIGAIYSDDPDTIMVARLSSPLVIGVCSDAHLLASDPAAVLEHTKKVVFLDDYDVAKISSKTLHIHNIRKAATVRRKAEELDMNVEQARLGDYDHFMLKEIHEASQTIKSASRGRIRIDPYTVKLGGLESVTEQLHYIDRIVIVACGTSYFAGMVGEYLIEEIAGIPVEVQLASEFKYRNEPFSRSTALLAISQSGETADTIAALKKVEGYGVLRLGVVNTVGSTIARLTGAGVYCHAGPELSVASTKAFVAQVTVLAEIALHLSTGKSPLFRPLIKELGQLPVKADEVLAEAKEIKKIADKYAAARDFLFIGRRYLYPCALEGALKLKEISYIHAEGYAAGEMKHGPLAMIDPHFPTVALACDSPLIEKTYSNMEEIRARKGPIIAIATKGNKAVKRLADDVIYIPKTLEQTQPLLAAIVVQLFAYYIAVKLGHNVDRPRNLAKSVTVE